MCRTTGCSTGLAPEGRGEAGATICCGVQRHHYILCVSRRTPRCGGAWEGYRNMASSGRCASTWRHSGTLSGTTRPTGGGWSGSRKKRGFWGVKWSVLHLVMPALDALASPARGLCKRQTGAPLGTPVGVCTSDRCNTPSKTRWGSTT